MLCVPSSVPGLGLSRAVKAERRLHRISARLAEPSRSSRYRSWHFCGVGYQFQTHGFIILHITGIQTIQCTMKGLHKDYHTTADYRYNKRWHEGARGVLGNYVGVESLTLEARRTLRRV